MIQTLGNNDFRGYLNYLASSQNGQPGDAKAYNALQFTGNDGGIDEGKLREYTAGPTGNPADDQRAYDEYAGYVADRWNEWNNRDSGGTGVLGLNNTTSGSGTQDYQREINRINSLLGVYAPQLKGGLERITGEYGEDRTRLNEQKTKALTGYENQRIKAVGDRTRGYEDVDNFAFRSNNSLNRIFQGANAGNSSVARLLAPQLVGKASDSRRLGVTTTANENLGNIKTAKEDAEADFGYAEQELFFAF